MRFTKVNIYGFGKWIDHSISFSKEQGLISLYGENESGKTTLQQFILYMLFDLPPKMRRFYQPKTSSKFGGQLLVEDKEIGIFTIERTSEGFMCLLPDGKIEDSAWFTNYLDGISKEVYESIYSFSAEQLEKIRQIKEQELSDVLFSVGITGATTVYETENALGKEMDQLFKPQGSNPLLNKQVAKVKEIQTKVNEQKAKEHAYVKWAADKEETKTEIGRLEQLARHTQEQLLFFKQIDHLLPSIFAFREHADKLTSYPKELAFPEQGIQRYEELKREMLPIKTKSDSLQNMILKLDENRKEIEETIAPLSVYQEAQQVIKQRQIYDDLANQLHMVSIEINQIDEQMREQAQAIDAPIEMIEGKRFPLQVQKEWEDIARKEIEITRTKEQYKEEKKYIADQEKTLTEQIKMAEKNVYPHDKIREMQEKVKEHDEYKRLQREYAQRQSVWDAFQEKRKGLASKVLLASLILGVLLVATYFILDSSLLLVLGIVAIVAGVVVYFTMQSTMTQIHGMLNESNETEMPISDVTRIEYDRKIGEQADWKQRLNGLLIDQENLEKKVAMLDNRISQQDVARNILEDRVSKNRQEYPVLDDINPAHWSGLFDSIQKIKVLSDEKEKKLEQKQMIQGQYHVIDQQLQSFAPYLNLENEPLTMFALEKWIFSFEKYKEQLEQDKRVQDEYTREQAQLQEQIDVIQGEMNQLFTYAHAQNEEAYYRMNELYQSQKESEQIVSQFKNHLTHAFSEEMQREILENPWSEQSVQVSIDKLTGEQTEIADQLTSLQQQLAEIEHTMKEQETSEDLSKTTLAYEIEKEQLHELAEQWLVLKVAHQSLQNAKMNYQEKYLNQIIDLTTTYFAKMTNNRYTKIYPPTKDTAFEVEASTGGRFNVMELSKGSIDQLYIALRFAIGYVMSEKYDVPFIVDDAFVHFDQDRLIAAMEIIKDISYDRQIILFTCHQEVANLTNAIPLTKQSSFVS